MTHGAVDVLADGLRGGEEPSTQSRSEGDTHGEVGFDARLKTATGAGAVGAGSLFGGHEITFRRDITMLHRIAVQFKCCAMAPEMVA